MVWSACSGTEVSHVIHLNSTHGRIKFVTSYYFICFVIFFKMILRSDKSYAKKKGFNIMFTVNGDGSGEAGNEKVPFYENDVIRSGTNEDGKSDELYIAN